MRIGPLGIALAAVCLTAILGAVGYWMVRVDSKLDALAASATTAENNVKWLKGSASETKQEIKDLRGAVAALDNKVDERFDRIDSVVDDIRSAVLPLPTFSVTPTGTATATATATSDPTGTTTPNIEPLLFVPPQIIPNTPDRDEAVRQD